VQHCCLRYKTRLQQQRLLLLLLLAAQVAACCATHLALIAISCWVCIRHGWLLLSCGCSKACCG
jgi:hypothetical protein